MSKMIKKLFSLIKQYNPVSLYKNRTMYKEIDDIVKNNTFEEIENQSIRTGRIENKLDEIAKILSDIDGKEWVRYTYDYRDNGDIVPMGNSSFDERLKELNIKSEEDMDKFIETYNDISDVLKMVEMGI